MINNKISKQRTSDLNDGVSLKSFVGGHSIDIYKDCTYDEKTRKYTGGYLSISIPYSGRMLSAEIIQEESEPLMLNGKKIPIKTCQKFADVDALPDESECHYCIVSALYVAACKALGRDTSRLLTMDLPVVGDDGTVIGTIGLNRN